MPSKLKEKPKRQHGLEQSEDRPWNDKKVKLFQALKKAKATTSDKAKTVSELAALTSLSQRDVRHYAYHARAADLVVVEKQGNHYKIHLSKAGAAIDPVKELKKAQAASAPTPAEKE